METRHESTTGTRNLSPEKLVDDLKAAIQRCEEKTVEQAKAADKLIRANPYQTIGIVFGLGILIGFLVRRR